MDETPEDKPKPKPGTVIQRGSAEWDGHERIEFHWTTEYVTPLVVTSVGSIIIQWAWLDHEITSMCQLFWRTSHPDEALPQSFSNRADILQQFAADLYLSREPEEYRIFAWFLQRVRSANGQRDDLAHGQYGMITKGGRKYEGLMVPIPSGSYKYPQMSMKKMQTLAEEIPELLREASQVSYALYKARAAASSQETHREQVDGVWTRLTWDNRNPKLPRWRPPPPTWNP
jgi:hypothetical protein